MRLIQPLKFRTLKTGCFKMPRLQMGVLQTGITVASGLRLSNFEWLETPYPERHFPTRDMASYRITSHTKSELKNCKDECSTFKAEACQTDMSGRGCIIISLSALPFLSVAEHYSLLLCCFLLTSFLYVLNALHCLVVSLTCVCAVACSL